MRAPAAILLGAALLACAGSDEPDECEPTTASALSMECEPGGPGGPPFSPGPYGERPGDLAEDLTLPALGGELKLSDRWTGCDSWIFLALDPQSPAGETLLGLSYEELFAGPGDVHYVFLSTGSPSQAADDAALFFAVTERELDLAGPEVKDRWKDRLHFPTVPLADAAWLGTALASWPEVADGFAPYGLVIDRFQRLRELGSLSWPAAQDWPPVPWLLAAAAENATYEWELSRRIAADGATVVPLFTGQTVQGSATAQVELPDVSELDTMELDLRLSCPSRFDRSCGEWDYLIYLRLCDAKDPEKCDVELGRWITSYHRGGHWLTDVSPLLALLRGGGKRTFRFETSNAYAVDLSLRLRRTCKGGFPVEAIPLWKGGAFDTSYGAGHPPVTVNVPDGAKRVEIVAVITGHGFGADAANCAEFCNHEHRFTVGGQEWVKDFPEAGTVAGCLAQVKDGVTPNQFGTWIFGRGGWCPGFDVPPFVADVTARTRAGPNEIGYRATFQGQSYVPQPVENSSGFGGRIDLESWLVIWK